MLLALMIAGLLIGVWVVSFVVPTFAGPAFSRGVKVLHRQLERTDMWFGRTVPASWAGAATEAPLIAALAVGLIAGLWAFFDLLEDVVMGEPIVGADKAVYLLMQQLRQAPFDTVLIGITELGDAKVVVPVMLAALAVLGLLRRWRAAVFVLVATAGAGAFVAGVKAVIHRPRPVSIYDGVAHYSFPSGHATMSVVLYGFLAFLLAYGAPVRWRRPITFVALSLIALISFSRVYLGAHWMSDVLAGLAFGVAWAALLAIIYLRARPRPMPLGLFGGVLIVALAGAGAWHMSHDLVTEAARYSNPARMP